MQHAQHRVPAVQFQSIYRTVEAGQRNGACNQLLHGTGNVYITARLINITRVLRVRGDIGKERERKRKDGRKKTKEKRERGKEKEKEKTCAR